MAAVVRVFVVDNCPVFCAGIQFVLQDTPDLQFCGSAASWRHLDAQDWEEPPDVILWTADTAGNCVLPEAVLAWKQEQKGKWLLVMLPDNDEICLRQLTAQSVDGCVLKNAPPRNFILAVRSVAIGENWFSRRLLQESLQIPAETADPLSVSPADLTEQDKTILRLVCAEKSNGEIAAAMHISERTVCRYLEDVYIKLDVHSRVGAAVWVAKKGLA